MDKIIYLLKGIVKIPVVFIGAIVWVIPYSVYYIIIILIEVGSNNTCITGNALHS